ncbi:MAG TPA: hypothetical protein VFK04_19530, partial [Gemmatimonadaceae bacterium]|nr:hypothetical protein [Gemmatimonadaceae bacterium]
GQVWFGAVNEVVVQWLVTPSAPPLESYYPELRRLLWRGLGVDPDRVVAKRGGSAARSTPRPPSARRARNGSPARGRRGGRR